MKMKCGDCYHFKKCEWLVQAKPDWDKCDFEPSRYRESLKTLIIEGLRTDGGHHKQWYLEEIAKASGFNLDELRKEINAQDDAWEPGIAP